MATARASERTSPVDFFDQHVAPVVFERLDELFPEFGFIRDRDGWRATNGETTHAFFGARADRVVCHRSGGFYVHGQGAVSWLSHLESGAMPRGRDYVDAVRRLARAAGIDTGPLDHGRPEAGPDPMRATAVREAWFQHAVELLHHSGRGADGRAYLTSRGIRDLDAIDGLIGVAPLQPEAWKRLLRDGHDREAIGASGVLADSRLAGRIVGAWRDDAGHMATAWARSIDPEAAGNERYLYLRGARRPSLPYLAYEAKTPDVVIVEGVLDALAMHAHGNGATIALGGSSATEATWRALSRRGVRQAWLLADHDAGGNQACRAATRSVLRGANAPRLSIRVDDPRAEYKDMAALLAAHPGVVIDSEWLDERCVDCIDHETRSILGAHRATRTGRQAAFDESARFLASVPDAHVLGRDAAVGSLAAWARLDVSAIHSLIHTREDASSLRARVVQLEAAVGTARDLLGSARLPAPPAEDRIRADAIVAHELVATAFQLLDETVPSVVVDTPPSASHAHATERERSIR